MKTSKFRGLDEGVRGGPAREKLCSLEEATSADPSSRPHWLCGLK